MIWMLIVDIVFFALLGLLTFPLVVLMVAHLSGATFDNAYNRVKAFLAKWAEVQPQDFLDRVLKASGVTAVLFLLGFGAYVANRVGDAAIPQSAAAFGYFGSDQVRWSVESEKEWDEVRRRFRDVTGIGPDRLKWEQAKAEMGRYDVRFFRTVAAMSFFVAISAVVALFRKGTRSKAFVTLLTAFLVLVASHWLWVEREQQYMENLISRYVSEYMKTHDNVVPERPPSYKGWWPGSYR